MILTLSGSQGQGKSTILASLQELGYNIIPNKTARSILGRWNTTLPEVYADRKLCMKFHEEILRVHDETCKPYYDESKVSFIERSYADVFAYALVVNGPYNECSEWLNNFYHECLEAQAKLSGTVYISGRVYSPQNDGVRSTNEHFATLIDASIKRYLDIFDFELDNHMVFHIPTPDHQERVDIIQDIISVYYN